MRFLPTDKEDAPTEAKVNTKLATRRPSERYVLGCKVVDTPGRSVILLRESED